MTFHYPSRPDTPALDDFSLDVRAGEKVALVGPSGAGKTTVFQLLLRFYDPQAGAVRIDGVDLRAADPRDVRRAIGARAAGSGDLRGERARERSLWPSRRERRRSDARRATRPTRRSSSSGCREGFDSLLGERGVRLSGGQRQRLAIARAILADRPILLLDEATSALDAESERIVQLALERLMAGRTVLMIAHRLATVRHADRIAVMERGRIVALGTHDALVARQSAVCASRGAAVRRPGSRGGAASEPTPPH